MRLLVTLTGVVILAVPSIAQVQNTIDPEVRQQIEASIIKADEAFNKSDATSWAAGYSQDAVEVWSWEAAGGAAISQQAIEIRAAIRLALNPVKRVRKLVQVYPVGDGICAISEFEHTFEKKGYCVAIYVRELDEWKVRMAYWK